MSAIYDQLVEIVAKHADILPQYVNANTDIKDVCSNDGGMKFAMVYVAIENGFDVNPDELFDQIGSYKIGDLAKKLETLKK